MQSESLSTFVPLCKNKRIERKYLHKCSDSTSEYRAIVCIDLLKNDNGLSFPLLILFILIYIFKHYYSAIVCMVVMIDFISFLYYCTMICSIFVASERRN